MNKITFLFVTALIFVFQVSYSQDGVLDATFGENGKLYLDFGTYESEMAVVLVQPDDMILAAGVRHNHGVNQQFFIIRYKGSGLLDENFGIGGKIESNFTDTPFLGTMLLQPDGKIIVSGYVSSNSPDYHTKSFIMRYSHTGSLDTGFGDNGILINNDFRIGAICLQSDGKIVVSTYGFDVLHSNNGLMRYNSNGTIDTTFGSNGFVSTENIATGLQISGVKQDSKGKLTAIGQFGDDYNKDVVIGRFGVNGVLDTSFGNNGFLLFNEDAIDKCSSLKIFSNDRILFYLSSYHFEGYEVVEHNKLIKLLYNGDYDADFGSHGRLDLEQPIFPFELQADGKILVGGAYDSGIYDNPKVVGTTRYLANGSLDATFGINGVVMTSAGNNTRGGANAIAFQSDGRIVVGATFAEAYLSAHPHTLLLRYNSQFLGQPEFNMVKNDFVVYPNPFEENIVVDFNFNQSKVLNVDLYDSGGRFILNLLKDRNFQSGLISQRLNLPQTLSRGIYFLHISSGTNTTTIKLIK